MKRRVKKRSCKVGLLVLASLLSTNLGSLAETNVSDFGELETALKGNSDTINFLGDIRSTKVLDVVNDFVLNGGNKTMTTDDGYHRAFWL